MTKETLTDDILTVVKKTLRPEIDASVGSMGDKLENAFGKALGAVRDEVATLNRNFAAFADRADRQLEVHESELAELKKFNTNSEAHRAEQREEMKQLRETIGELVSKLNSR